MFDRLGWCRVGGLGVWLVYDVFVWGMSGVVGQLGVWLVNEVFGWSVGGLVGQ